MLNLKRGCLPFQAEAVKLYASDYWDRSKLPVVPDVFGHVDNSIEWGMLANDMVGDCVMAGAAHRVMVWNRAVERGLVLFTDAGVRRQYFSLAGGLDEGLDPIAAAKWETTTGIADAGGNVHRTKGFSVLGSLGDLGVATYMYGSVGLCINLPDNAEDYFRDGKPWTDTSASGSGGHYVVNVGRNSHGLWVGITWGVLQAYTQEWLEKYCMGVLVYYSEEYLLPSGVSPEAIKGEELDADLARLA